MEIYHYNDISQELWDEMVNLSDDSWLFHLQIWLDGTSKVFNAENHYFIVKENGTNIAGFALQKHGDFLYSTLMGNTGPFIINGLSSEKRTQIYDELTNEVVNWAKNNKIETIYCSLPGLALNNLNNIRGINPLILSEWDDTSTHTKIIDLTKTEDELWLDLAKSSRRKIKAAKAKGYHVEKVNFKDMLDEYYGIHTETYLRTGVPPHPKAYFEIISDMSLSGKVELQACKDSSGNAVAFLNSGRYKNGVCIWTCCSKTSHIKNGINYLLLWTDIMDAKKSGYNWYEITEVFPNAKSGKLQGLTIFKSRFGGDLYRFYKGRIEISKPSFIKCLIRKAKRKLYCFYKVQLAKKLSETGVMYFKLFKFKNAKEKYGI